MLKRAFFLLLIPLVLGVQCDGLDDLAKGLSGFESDDGSGEHDALNLGFVNTVKMADGDRSLWGTDGFTIFNDPVGDAVGSYADIEEIRIAHNANNLYVEISREDASWDFSADSVRLYLEIENTVYTVVFDFDGTYTISTGDEITCDNSSQEIIEGIQDGGVLLAKFPLNQSENVINCFPEEVKEIEKFRVATSSNGGECEGGECDVLEIDTPLALTVPDDSVFDVQEMDNVTQFVSTLTTIDDSSATFIDSTTSTAIDELGDINRMLMAHNPDFEELYFGLEIRGTSDPTDIEFVLEMSTDSNDKFRIQFGSPIVPEIFVNNDSNAVCQAGDLGFTAPSPTPTAGGTYAFELDFLLDDCLPGIDSDTVIESLVLGSKDSSELELDLFDVRRLSLNP